MSLLTPGDLAAMSATLHEHSNATLTAIETPGPLAGNGDPGEPVAVWTGEARGFLERQDRDALSDGVQARIQMDTFTLFDVEALAHDIALETLRPGADWQATSIVVRDERLSPATLWRFTIRGAEHQADGTLDHTLLTLNGKLVG